MFDVYIFFNLLLLFVLLCVFERGIGLLHTFNTLIFLNLNNVVCISNAFVDVVQVFFLASVSRQV